MSSGAQNQIVGRSTLAENVKRWAKVYVVPQVQRVTDLFGVFKVDVPFTINLDPLESIDYEEKLVRRNKLLLEMGVVTAQEIRATYVQNVDRTPMNLSLENDAIPETDTVSVSVSKTPKTDELYSEIDSELDSVDWESLLLIDVDAITETEIKAAELYNNG
jgi:hypothetical protein